MAQKPHTIGERPCASRRGVDDSMTQIARAKSHSREILRYASGRREQEDAGRVRNAIASHTRSVVETRRLSQLGDRRSVAGEKVPRSVLLRSIVGGAALVFVRGRAMASPPRRGSRGRRRSRSRVAGMWRALPRADFPRPRRTGPRNRNRPAREMWALPKPSMAAPSTVRSRRRNPPSKACSCRRPARSSPAFATAPRTAPRAIVSGGDDRQGQQARRGKRRLHGDARSTGRVEDRRANSSIARSIGIATVPALLSIQR